MRLQRPSVRRTSWALLALATVVFGLPASATADEGAAAPLVEFTNECDPENSSIFDHQFSTCNAPPVCDLAEPSVAVLAPANHGLMSVMILGVTDPDGDAVAVTALGVFQDEPLDGEGDGQTHPDGVIDGDAAWLRAERSGDGDGRVYHVSFSADDGNGGVCLGTVEVSVPHDAASAAVDGGPLYDSTG